MHEGVCVCVCVCVLDLILNREKLLRVLLATQFAHIGHEDNCCTSSLWCGVHTVAKTVRNVAIPIEMMRVNTSMVVTIVVEREKRSVNQKRRVCLKAKKKEKF